jgi:hypothetical protein
MTNPATNLSLDSPTREYEPGQSLSGEFVAAGGSVLSLKAVELSVLWYTAGQGDEDFGVHYFERLVEEPAQPLDLRQPHRFTTPLPASPLSYEGQIVKVCWCVRLRLFPKDGPETVEELAFRLGAVPAAGVATAAAEDGS